MKICWCSTHSFFAKAIVAHNIIWPYMDVPKARVIISPFDQRACTPFCIQILGCCKLWVAFCTWVYNGHFTLEVKGPRPLKAKFSCWSKRSRVSPLYTRAHSRVHLINEVGTYEKSTRLLTCIKWFHCLLDFASNSPQRITFNTKREYYIRERRNAHLL